MVVKLKDAAVTVAEPRERLAIRDLMICAHAREVMTERMQLECLGASEIQRSAKLLNPLEQLPFVDIRKDLIAVFR
ncbi:MAG: hypothetical protein ABSD28_12290 [Tepidisphaeraceae bacterium]